MVDVGDEHMFWDERMGGLMWNFGFIDFQTVSIYAKMLQIAESKYSIRSTGVRTVLYQVFPAARA